jgi:AcrR family transcriptional regulator
VTKCQERNGVHNDAVPERWTQERRRQHTRDLLLDAAEEVFARKGFEGSSLEEIADTAGYTRGAIYKHFGGKEELFLAANKRFNERFLEGFLDLLDPATPLEELDLATIAKRWRESQSDDLRTYALGTEFNLYVLRNPEVRKRVAEHRRAVPAMIARFIEEQIARHGLTLRIPSYTLARIVVAATEGLERAKYLDDDQDDLYEPFLELLLSAWEPTPAGDAGDESGGTASS